MFFYLGTFIFLIYTCYLVLLFPQRFYRNIRLLTFMINYINDYLSTIYKYVIKLIT